MVLAAVRTRDLRRGQHGCLKGPSGNFQNAHWLPGLRTGELHYRHAPSIYASCQGVMFWLSRKVLSGSYLRLSWEAVVVGAVCGSHSAGVVVVEVIDVGAIGHVGP